MAKRSRRQVIEARQKKGQGSYSRKMEARRERLRQVTASWKSLNEDS